jgi:tRNA nucleotidyltransferase (CCA-adding enzyme)
MKVYRVGGAVRDRLLGRPRQDEDWVVVGATPQQMAELGYRPVGSGFPVFLHPKTNEEYALARTERKSGHGYGGFTFHAAPDVTLEQDLARRDLTINAMAEAPDGSLIDPFGGERDLEQRLLRHVSPAFAEDPVRVLRVARFAARYAGLGFRVAEETLALMAASGELLHLLPERVWAETASALDETRAPRYFEVLRDCGALAVLFPEIDALFGVPQRADHHPEIDSGVHTLMVLAQACRLTEDNVVRFAALVHDLGKALTPREELPQHIGHEERSVPLVDALCDRLRVPNHHRELARLVARHHLVCHGIHERRPATVLRLLESLDAFRRPPRFEQFLVACEADMRGRAGFEERAYPQADLLRRAFAAARDVATADLDDGTRRGTQIAELLRQRRIEAIGSEKLKMKS